MSTTRWHARPLVGLTVAKLARDTYQQLRDLDQALDATVGITTLDSLTDVVITTGAAHDTLRYDGTTWRNSAFLRNTTTAVTVGTDPGGSEIMRVGGQTRQTGTHFVALGAITADQQTLTRTLEWNNSGVTFVGDYMDLTPTAYASGSKPFDYRINGTPRFYMQVPNPLGDQSSLGFIQITPPDNQVALNLTSSRTGTQGGEGVLNITAFMNTTSHPSLFYVNAVNAGGYGTSTQLMRAAVDGGTLFGVTATGNVGLSGGPTSDVWVRIGPGGSAAAVEEGLQVNPTMTNTGFLSHWVVNVLGGGAASGSAYTTPEVFGIQVGTYAKALNQTITTWYGLDILAGPTAGTKWSVRTAESVWIKGNLVVDGTISGFTGIGAHTHAETDITDGSLLARVAANETISGSWTFTNPLTITPDAGEKALVVTGVSQTTSQPLLDLAQTWNAGGVTFSAARIAITRTAAASPSYAFETLLGGGRKFGVTDEGLLVVGYGTADPNVGILAGPTLSAGSFTWMWTGQFDAVGQTVGANNTQFGGLYIGMLNTPGSFTGLEHHGIWISGATGALTGTRYGLRIGDVSGATTNYALYTGSGRVRLGGVIETAAGQESTGAGSAALGSNSPAGTLTAPNTWLAFRKSDGTTLYVPAWA